MKLEVYPAYADQLNSLVRSDRSKRGIWGDVVKRAAELMRKENGERNCYPQVPAFFPREDPEIRQAQVTIARASQRGRWVYLSIAAREILKREQRILIGLLVAVLVAGLVVAPARADNPTVSLAITPQQVNRYDSFLLTVTTAQPNTTFNASIAGVNGFYIAFTNSTDAKGIYVANLSAYYSFGQYEIDVSIANATARGYFTIGCDASCTQEIQNTWGLQIAQLVYGELEKWGLYVLIGVLALETPRVVSYFRRWSKYAQAHGAYTPREQAAAPFVLMRGHVNPADNVADPRNPQNARILVDAKRRQLLEQLHDATGKKYLEWHPDHLQDLDDLFHDLRSAWGRQLQIQPEASPTARIWSRPKEKSLAATLETSPRSAPIEPPKPTSDLNRTRARSDPLDDMAAWAKQQRRETPRKRPARAWKGAVVATGILGVPMAVLVLAARTGLYVEPLRALWVGFPGDELKVAIGFGSFAVSVAGWRAAIARSRIRLEA